jgi:two-component system response regulator
MTNQTILLVEDNPDDAALALRALRKHNVPTTVVVARDGVEALDYLFGTGSYAGRDPQLLPRVILLDLKLPRMDGHDVLRELRAHERTRTIPVVMLTSSKEDRDLSMSYSLGVNSYICKPVNFSEFSEAVRQLGTYWLSLNEEPPRS